MTFIFPISNLMFGRLIPNKKSKTIVNEFNELQDILGLQNFKLIFPAILTDRGNEFIDADGIENDEYGNARTRIFYCDPYSSSQKPEIERNHEFFRFYVPSGESLNDITQEQVDLMFSHINSYNREARGHHTPYEYFAFIYGKEIYRARTPYTLSKVNLVWQQNLPSFFLACLLIYLLHVYHRINSVLIHQKQYFSIYKLIYYVT